MKFPFDLRLPPDLHHLASKELMFQQIMIKTWTRHGRETKYFVHPDMKGVVSVFRSRVLKLHTTRSWDFIGLALYSSEVTPLQLTYGDDVVVGVFDTSLVLVLSSC